MVVSTKPLVRVVPAPPAPPACVLAAASASALTFDEDLEIDRAHAVRQAELLAEAIAPVLQGLIDANGLYAVAGAIELVLGRQLGPATGEPLKCTVSLRPATEANGWF